MSNTRQTAGGEETARDLCVTIDHACTPLSHDVQDQSLRGMWQGPRSVQVRRIRRPAGVPATRFAAAVALAMLDCNSPGQDVPDVPGQEPSSPAFRESWTRFTGRHSGPWSCEWNSATQTPKAIYGRGIEIQDWRESTLCEARRHAHRLLDEEEELLALGNSEFRESIAAPMGNVFSFVLDQYYNGVQALGGRIDVRVHRTGRISMFGSTAWRIPPGFSVVPRIDELAASQIAAMKLQTAATPGVAPSKGGSARLVIWGDVHASHRVAPVLCWEVPLAAIDALGNGPAGRYYIDAALGDVLHFESDKHELCSRPTSFVNGRAPDKRAPDSVTAIVPIPTTITVMAWTRVALHASAPLANVPVKNLVVTVPGLGTRVTDHNGRFAVDLIAPTTLTVGAVSGVPMVANFVTTHGTVYSAWNVGVANTVTVQPGVATTIQLLSASAPQDWVAHTSAIYWIDRVNSWARGVIGVSPQIGNLDSIVAQVNISSVCNAYYLSNRLHFYGEGGGCNNTAFSTVIAHEWGHALDDQYGGVSTFEGLSEGWADICAMYLTDQAGIGDGLIVGSGAIRSGNNGLQYPVAGGVHEQGQTWMGFAWKLRDRIAGSIGRGQAIDLTNRIVVGTIVANARSQPDAVREVFLADDNDGDLTNGTPNWSHLVWACGQHSLPFPRLFNDECVAAVPLVTGLNGAFSSAEWATSSSPPWPCWGGGADAWFSYDPPTSGTLTVSACGQAAFDTVIEAFSGTCGSLASLGCNDDACGLQSSLVVGVAGRTLIRVGGYAGARGVFRLDVAFTPTTSTVFGDGCYEFSRSFHEVFSNATNFDLASSALCLIWAPGYYIARRGGAFVRPGSSASRLVFSTTDEILVPLVGTFPCATGRVSMLAVCKDGYVSASAGQVLNGRPRPAGWRRGPRWGCWHIMNPNMAGSGQVFYEQIGGVLYVTWDGVFDSATPPGINTWQLQFDLATGDVVYAFGAVTAPRPGPREFLVGYVADGDSGGPSVDISAALPGTFRTSVVDRPSLALRTTLPRLGSVLSLTVSYVPDNCSFVALALGMGRVMPGADLGNVGMPGCLQHVSPDAVALHSPLGGSAVVNLAVPNSQALVGLRVYGQSVAHAPGANSAALITSNGVALQLGY